MTKMRVVFLAGLLLSFVAGTAASAPELRVTRFGLDNPILRVGENGAIVLDVKNVGTGEAESVAASVTLADRESYRTRTLPLKRIAKLAPGAVTRFEWNISPKDASEKVVVCRVTGQGLDGAEKSFGLKPCPKHDPAVAERLKYVPEPVQADTDGYLVGAYYFPGWHTYDRWAVLDDYPERHPVLGYYREGDPEIVDWQISWALDHGISFFIYDWYWNKGQRSNEHALHDGLFKSRYQDKFKFCLLWANHNPPKTSSEEDLLNVTRYWIDNYFRRPNYLKVGGKNVMVIFTADRLTEDMGSTAVKAAFGKMREMCEKSGVGGLYLVACAGVGAEQAKRLADEGYDALSGYNYSTAGSKGQKMAPYEWMVDGYLDWWTGNADASGLPYIPVCEPGWDARPWHGSESVVRTGKSPALWKKMLENAKAFADDAKHKQTGDKRLVFLEAWNEFGEGDYIEPHAEFGFDYLEAVRQVFAPSSKKPTIIVPKDIGLGPYELKKPEAK